MMESTRQKTFKLLKAVLSVSVVLLIICLLSLALSIAGSFQVIRVAYGDTIKVTLDGETSIIRLVGIDTPETSKRKNEPGQRLTQKSKKNFIGLVLNKSVEFKLYGTDNYGWTLEVVNCNSTYVNLEMVIAGLAEVYRGLLAPRIDNGSYQQARQEARKDDRGVWSLGDKFVSPGELRLIGK